MPGINTEAILNTGAGEFILLSQDTQVPLREATPLMTASFAEVIFR